MKTYSFCAVKNIPINYLSVATTILLVITLTCTTLVRAMPIINTGFNLFQTTPDSTFFFGPPVPNEQFVDFEGNPIGLFDFGSGPVDVGVTDTIIERKQTANLSSGSDTIDIEMVALSLKSVSPVDLGFGAGLEQIFITLNTSSPATQSTMTIYDTGPGQPHGTFDSILNFSFDVIGSVGGLYDTLEKTITALNQPWQFEPTGTLLLDGVNHNLNTTDESNDFWAGGIVIHDDGSDTMIHKAKATSVPEPSTILLMIVGIAALALRRQKKWLITNTTLEKN